MHAEPLDMILKRFETADESRVLIKGRFEIVRLGGMTIGRATYEPGWKWSEHVGPGVGASRCLVEHVGMVVSGRATAAVDDGRVLSLQLVTNCVANAAGVDSANSAATLVASGLRRASGRGSLLP